MLVGPVGREMKACSEAVVVLTDGPSTSRMSKSVSTKPARFQVPVAGAFRCRALWPVDCGARF